MEPAKKMAQISSKEEGGDGIEFHHADEKDEILFRGGADHEAYQGRNAEQVIAEKIAQRLVAPPTFQRIMITEEPPSAENADVSSQVAKVASLRGKWVFRPKDPGVVLSVDNHIPFNPLMEATARLPNSGHVFKMGPDGVFQVFMPQDTLLKTNMFPVASLENYYDDLRNVMRLVEHGPAKSFCFSRLALLEKRFEMHLILNEESEIVQVKSVPRRDFYNVRKIDTHLHHSAIMNAKHLLKFIKKKLNEEGDEVVIFRDGKYLTLREVFQSLQLTAENLSIDKLDCHADRKIFHRFDRFNAKYNPIGDSRLRTVFLKTDNHIKGRFFAEITREVFSQYESSKYLLAEPRLSVYGRSKDEFSKLGAWVFDHSVYSSHVRYMVQIPRLYNLYREAGELKNFGEFLRNIFDPLFAVTIDPNSDLKLHCFLKMVVGVDLVDDESKPEYIWKGTAPNANDWTGTSNPPYSYYLYYIYANLYVLNKLREARGFNTLALRPHSGEAGYTNHLACAFLLSESIAHGILLRKAPVLQYLYYLSQIGISMSPISNNKLFLEFSRSPFLSYFKQGLCCTLSTDDPVSKFFFFFFFFFF